MSEITSALDLANLALSKISAGQITDFTSGRTGQLCAKYFESSMGEVLSHDEWARFIARYTPTARASTVTDFGYEVDLLTAPYQEYVSTKAYVLGDKVYYLLTVYQCVGTSTGNLPTNGTYWQPWSPVTPSVYSGATAYTLGQVVTDGLISYECTQAGTGHQPSVSPTYWKLYLPVPTNILRVIDLSSAMDWIVEGTTLYTDDKTPVIRYVKKLTQDSPSADFLNIPYHLLSAMAYRLAFAVIFELSGNKELQTTCQGEYMTALTLARQFNAQHSQSKYVPESQWSEA